MFALAACLALAAPRVPPPPPPPRVMPARTTADAGEESPPPRAYGPAEPTPGDLAVAAELIAQPPGVPVPPHLADSRGLLDAVVRVAVGLEILDPGETRHVLVFGYAPGFAAADLDMLRQRRVELADAPPVGDGYRFPDPNAVKEASRFNQAFRKRVELGLKLEQDRAGTYQTVLRETDWLGEVWDAAGNARCLYYYVSVRRAALKRLRDLLGEEAYRAAEMPPAVPTWRFNEMR